MRRICALALSVSLLLTLFLPDEDLDKVQELAAKTFTDEKE